VALNLEGKKAIVAEVSVMANNAISLVVADYRGLSGDAMTTLRHKAREKGVSLKVIRNTLARRAFQGTSFECMDKALVGPLIFGFAEMSQVLQHAYLKTLLKRMPLFKSEHYPLQVNFMKQNTLIQWPHCRHVTKHYAC
jgi:ribosomal protein L10